MLPWEARTGTYWPIGPPGGQLIQRPAPPGLLAESRSAPRQPEPTPSSSSPMPAIGIGGEGGVGSRSAVFGIAAAQVTSGLKLAKVPAGFSFQIQSCRA